MKIEVATPAAKSLSLDDQVMMHMLAVEQAQSLQKRAQARVRLSHALNDLGSWDTAEYQLSVAKREAASDPFVLRALGLAHLRNGRFEQGVRTYDEGRKKLGSYDKFKRPYTFRAWQGQDLNRKKILVWAEQGVGDQVMHARVLHDLVSQGANVSVECEPRLIPLFQRALPNVIFETQTVPLVKGFVQQKFDFQSSMFSAWRWARKPGQFHGILKPDEELVQWFRETWQREDSNRAKCLNVGLSWSSKAAATGAKRTLSPEQLSVFQKISKGRVRFHNLQYDDRDATTLARRFGAPLWTDSSCDPLKNLDRQCAQIKALDLVISIDNATAHLAGAMGVPTWVLLPKGSEYRWGKYPSHCEIYPSVRLFRSHNCNAWAETLLDVTQALKTQIK